MLGAAYEVGVIASMYRDAKMIGREQHNVAESIMAKSTGNISGQQRGRKEESQ